MNIKKIMRVVGVGLVALVCICPLGLLQTKAEDNPTPTPEIQINAINNSDLSFITYQADVSNKSGKLNGYTFNSNYPYVILTYSHWGNNKSNAVITGNGQIIYSNRKTNSTNLDTLFVVISNVHSGDMLSWDKTNNGRFIWVAYGLNLRNFEYTCPSCPEVTACPEVTPCPTCPEVTACPEVSPCPACPSSDPEGGNVDLTEVMARFDSVDSLITSNNETGETTNTLLVSLNIGVILSCFVLILFRVFKR